MAKHETHRGGIKARADEIVKRKDAGESFSKIAKEYGFSPQGVSTAYYRAKKMQRPERQHFQQIEIPLKPRPQGNVAILIVKPDQITEVLEALWK